MDERTKTQDGCDSDVLSSNGSKGDISEQMIDNQMQVLNDAFEEAGFRFLLMKQGGKSASRTNNKKWHQGRDPFFPFPYIA